MYYPARNLSYQGEVYFRSENPDPEAVFRYYIKDGYTSLKSKRKKAQKEAFAQKTRIFEEMGDKKEWTAEDKKNIQEAVEWLQAQDESKDSIDMQIVRNAYIQNIVGE